MNLKIYCTCLDFLYCDCEWLFRAFCDLPVDTPIYQSNGVDELIYKKISHKIQNK